ncbi:hypothetical protein VNO77_11189 [Canavalia gladiata]|uniref:Uncharacterized protein n=1 Tax=Canavalia gladiata TaxID=3824 RepID=A0AAN9MCM2_CANGL
MQMKKSLWIVLVITMLVLSSHLCFVHSRVLRLEALKTKVADNTISSHEMASFVVSSNDSTTPASKRTLAFRLASGPSRKGPGH